MKSNTDNLKWISVKSERPNVDVCLIFEKGQIEAVIYDASHDCFFDFHFKQRSPTHWMPLPKSPISTEI